MLSNNVLLPLAAACLALLVWLPLGLAGVPLDTPYGLLHLNWAGAGTFALAIYPPLFRLLVGVPLAGLPWPPAAMNAGRCNGRC